jgi:hypothetical protein
MRELRTKTWLQYPAAPSIRGDAPPVWARPRSTAAWPAPEQSGYATAQSPPGTAPAWFSKPSQIAVGTQLSQAGGPGGASGGVSGGVPDVLGGVPGPALSPHATPLNEAGAALTPLNVP